VKIRHFEPTDFEEILKLYYDTIHTVNIRDYSPEQIDTWAPAIPDMTRWIGMLEHLAFVVEEKGQIIGFGDMTLHGYLDLLYTHKDFQGQGVASLILKELEKHAKEIGLREIHTEASITAKPFFEKKGFKSVRGQNKVFRNVGFTNYVMRKKLNY
jgi:putative acetyltransferase